MLSNLPPGVTDRMIEEAFGGADEREVSVTCRHCYADFTAIGEVIDTWGDHYEGGDEVEVKCIDCGKVEVHLIVDRCHPGL